jgi:predicted dehydrogenase
VGQKARANGANERFTVALIGCGGMGRYKLNNFMDTKQCDVVAICDVDDEMLEAADKDVQKKTGKAPKHVKDYRKVIDMKDLDIVIVATPDHWHAAPMMLACQAGKDVYVEKPCCHNILEGRAMVNAAKKYDRIVQVGTHQRSGPHMQEARKFVQDGKLGLISATQTYTYGNETPDGMGHAPDTDVPPGVDYDMWLGAAPKRPFNRRRFHGSWRWYFDYGCGMVGDWNVHLQDIIMWTMETPFPIAVCSMGGHLLVGDDRDTPDTMQTIYWFPPSKLAPKGHVHTYSLRKASGRPWWAGGYGMDFHGTNGYLHLDRSGWRVEPDKVDWGKGGSPNRIEPVEKKGADSHPEHVVNFLDCVRSRKTPIASIEKHFTTVAACHLANVSLKVGRKIWWDHKKELCFRDEDLKVPDKEANALLGREYRNGYELPEV